MSLGVPDRFYDWDAFLSCSFDSRKAALFWPFFTDGLDPTLRNEFQKGLTPAELRRFRSRENLLVDVALEKGARLISVAESGWFGRESLPPVLWARGELDLANKTCIAIVGTRKATSYGKACALKFAEAFARAGVVVVSGGALGIDAAAHQGALEAGGETVAVLPCGIDVAYPSLHRPLFDRIAESGMLVSRFAVGSTVEAHSFHARNAVIAAMSHATLVIEAPGKSGTTITAGFATDFGREVFVIPGPIDRPTFIGSHGLIRDGATLVTTPEQVLDAMGVQALFAPSPKLKGLSGRIVKTLGLEPMSLEVLAERLNVPTHELLSEITMLELDGILFRESGGYSLRR